jgi:hypothetical protein
MTADQSAFFICPGACSFFVWPGAEARPDSAELPPVPTELLLDPLPAEEPPVPTVDEDEPLPEPAVDPPVPTVLLLSPPPAEDDPVPTVEEEPEPLPAAEPPVPMDVLVCPPPAEAAPVPSVDALPEPLVDDPPVPITVLLSPLPAVLLPVPTVELVWAMARPDAPARKAIARADVLRCLRSISRSPCAAAPQQSAKPRVKNECLRRFIPGCQKKYAHQSGSWRIRARFSCQHKE